MRSVIILLAVLVLGLLTSLLVEVQTAKAQYTQNGAGCPLVSGINIISPSNTSYSSNVPMLNITINGLLSPSIYSFKIVYSIDGKGNATLPVTSTFVPVMATVTYANGTTTTAPSILGSYYSITGAVALSGLSEGSHCLTVYATYERVNDTNGNWPALIYDSNMVYFTINYSIPPIISNVSLENKTYNQNNLPLNFTTDKPTSWIGYSLDGKANITTAGNTTLTGLPSGAHSLIIYANDTLGNTAASGTIYFSVEAPFPTTIVGALASGAVMGIGLIVFFKKRNHA